MKFSGFPGFEDRAAKSLFAGREHFRSYPDVWMAQSAPVVYFCATALAADGGTHGR